MQELRLVAMSEDGRYLVLATAGRGTRFTLPIDDRLRAAVRGQLSRLGQYEIEVESPLRPKEIQARIRSGETAEEIAETAGIAVDRVRWFEGPVLQEREFMAQQAQRALVRRAGDQAPGPALGSVVEERLRSRSVDPEEVQWDSWKREDGTWRIRLSFEVATHPYVAEWIFNPQRRHVSPADEDAARLSALDDAVAEDEDTVTPLVPRRARNPEPESQPQPAQPAQQPVQPAQQPAQQPVQPAAQPAQPPEEQPQPAQQPVQPVQPAQPVQQPAQQPVQPAQPAQPAARVETQAEEPPQPQQAEAGEEPAQEEPAAEVAVDGSGSAVAAAASDQSQRAKSRPRKSGSGRGRRASVPSWDEIMFGARKQE